MRSVPPVSEGQEYIMETWKASEKIKLHNVIVFREMKNEEQSLLESVELHN